MEDLEILERIKGCLLGFAIGDAIGASREFQENAPRVSGFQPARSKGLGAGQYTDDTQQLMMALLSLTENNGEIDLDDLAGRLKYWLNSGLARSIGYTTRTAIQRLNQGIPPERSGINNPGSCGSFAIPRIIPYLLHSALKPDSYKIRRGDIKRVVGITHAHKNVLRMAELLNYYVQEMLYGKTAEETTLQIVCENQFLNKKFRTKLESLLNLQEQSVSPASAFDKIGQSGFVEHVILSGLYCAMLGPRFNEVVLNAANGNGDTDSRAAIAGALYGLQEGYSSIPKDLREVEDAPKLIRLAEKLFTLPRQGGVF